MQGKRVSIAGSPCVILNLIKKVLRRKVRGKDIILGSGVAALLAAGPAAAIPVAESRVQSQTQNPDQLHKQMLGKRSQNPMGQVTSVSQLRDVRPTDWSFQALQSLVERYGCIAGYPDGSFRGNRPLSRFEFAAGLNACLDRINELIAAATTSTITRDDLITLQRLQEEFAAELATLRGRIDALEARTAELQAIQFSTTARFGGEIIFAVAGGEGGEPRGNGDTENVIFAQLTRLGVATSFNGKDRLRLGFVASNFSNRGFSGGNGFNTDMALLSFQADTDNAFDLDMLEYRFATLGDRVVVTLRPVGFSLSNVLTANSPYFDNGRGAISRFAEANPIFKIGTLDAGVGFDWLVTDKMRLQVAYGTRDSNDPSEGRGVTGADHSALGVQLLTRPLARVLTGITYVNAYSNDGQLDTFTGSLNADVSGNLSEEVQIQAVGGTLQWRLTNDLVFGTWGGFTFANAVNSDNYANTETYLFSLGYRDPFGKEGDLLAFLFGQPPKLTDGRGLRRGEDDDTSLHFELFYRFQVNDNISITPGVFFVTNPEHNEDNDDIFVGLIRTVFRF
ncbi:MAG: iron uptake porin [Hormoscilla sp.]